VPQTRLTRIAIRGASIIPIAFKFACIQILPQN
jgi:hypothetical protein